MQKLCKKIMSAYNYHLYVFLWLSQIIISMKVKNSLLHEFVQCPHNESCDQYRNLQQNHMILLIST